MITGIDVSSCQGTIDWAAVAASGVRFAYIKCGNGNNSADPYFRANVLGARAAGIVVGTYHVGFPLPDDPAHPKRDAVSQAQMHFKASGMLGRAAGDLPPALDLEWPVPGSREWNQYGCSPAQVRAWALAYLVECERLHGRTPVLYDGFPVYWAAIGGDKEPAFARYPLWRVDYRNPPVTPGPWSSWTLWQKSGGGGKLPNGAPVDEDVFAWDDAQWQAFIGNAAAPVVDANNPPLYTAPDPNDMPPEAA